MGTKGGSLSQQEFSNRLGRSLSLIQRYEKGAGGIGIQELGKMVKLAREARREDLALSFRTAILEALGPDSADAIMESPQWTSVSAVPSPEVQDPNSVSLPEQSREEPERSVLSDTLSKFALTDEERGNVEALLYLMREGDPNFANAATGLLKPWFGRKLSAGDPAKAASSSDKGSSARTGRGDAARTKRAG
ncbi:MAG: hypothetical protein JWN34_3707 [Bryobacterales bacterium]|nr:hypothetical protein [Bryobacterales bacterium]